jgi:hypothetical protein
VIVETVTDPSLQRLDTDLTSAEAQAGVDAGLWRIVSLEGTILTIAVTAGDGRELGMRLAVDGYPNLPPAGQPWDLDADTALPQDKWPTGGSAPAVFSIGWSPSNGNAPYMACDRTGLATHPNWAQEHPTRAWHPRRTIAFYLREIHHELLGATLPGGAS